MKLLPFLVALFFSSTCFSQTIDETISWLKTKFEANDIVVYSAKGGNRFGTRLRLEQIEKCKCKIWLERFWEFAGKDMEVDLAFTPIDFSLLDPSQVVLKEHDWFFSFEIMATNSKKIVVINHVRNGEVYEQYQTNIFWLGYFSKDLGQDIQERMKKALIHLITVCGGKKEAF